MRHSQSEKMEIIRTVESSSLGTKQTLVELDINRSTFYDWYCRYREGGYDALASRPTRRGVRAPHTTDPCSGMPTTSRF